MNAPISKLAPSSHIEISMKHNECYFRISGFWSVEAIEEFIARIRLTAKPLRDADAGPIGVLGDFEGFIPQQEQTVALIKEQLHWAQNLGLKGLAIVHASTLVKLQFRRLSEGSRVEYFTNRAEALRWLRK